jgi:hypothetical protein
MLFNFTGIELKHGSPHNGRCTMEQTKADGSCREVYQSRSPLKQHDNQNGIVPRYPGATSSDRVWLGGGGDLRYANCPSVLHISSADSGCR